MDLKYRITPVRADMIGKRKAAIALDGSRPNAVDMNRYGYSIYKH